MINRILPIIILHASLIHLIRCITLDVIALETIPEIFLLCRNCLVLPDVGLLLPAAT
jgi:hypothetical protein